jgi:hypothetical protein
MPQTEPTRRVTTQAVLDAARNRPKPVRGPFPYAAVEVRMALQEERRIADEAAERRQVRAARAKVRRHDQLPAVKAYRAERRGFEKRTALRLEEAKREFARLMAAEAERRKGGRPPKPQVGKGVSPPRPAPHEHAP